MDQPKYYSQGQEEKYITEYFAGKKGALLSVGENDGRLFSNALCLIEGGWKAVLVEPAPIAFDKLEELHKDNLNVICLNVAITETDGIFQFWDSGKHVGGGDTSLLSTTVEKELDRWKNGRTEFTALKVPGITIKTMMEKVNQAWLPSEAEAAELFNFITIDAEGLDVAILKQIDLTNCKMLCIEWNGNEAAKVEIMQYCEGFGLNRLQFQNGENLIIVR